jgi:hypothetical protein
MSGSWAEAEAWLAGLGYRVCYRQAGWTECLVWRAGERWTGQGGDGREALADALGKMLPSHAARAGAPAEVALGPYPALGSLDGARPEDVPAGAPELAEPDFLPAAEGPAAPEGPLEPVVAPPPPDEALPDVAGAVPDAAPAEPPATTPEPAAEAPATSISPSIASSTTPSSPPAIAPAPAVAPAPAPPEPAPGPSPEPSPAAAPAPRRPPLRPTQGRRWRWRLTAARTRRGRRNRPMARFTPTP